MMFSHLVIFFLTWQYDSPVFAGPISGRECQVEGVPQFVIDYAPMVWLDKNETFFPSDIGAHVQNTAPSVNLTTIDSLNSPVSLTNLDTLNQFGNDGKQVYLTLREPIESNPKFLAGVVPDDSGETKDATSCAVIINDHGNGTVDAFYMYFYSFDKGNIVLSQELGDHVGDWEHNMIRFQSGTPMAIWYSQHSYGQAFLYEAVEKIGSRPVAYSARGTHANYAVSGDIDRKFPNAPEINLPKGFLADHTSQGKLWDPVKKAYFYTFIAEPQSVEPRNESPIGLMNFKGRWGDEEYPDGQHGQTSFFGFKKFVSGPTGPLDKQLNRVEVCPKSDVPCKVLDSLTG
ncbi:hypothetical protein K3495_g720 [Podosphaera aphanis]|nr:hypothetical protein K3495_g720 [Podosphaera aphanis]